MIRALCLLLLGAAPQEAPLRLEKGDRICMIGNTLPDRMQHHGWLETLINSRFPAHELVIRNLGFSGDELTLRLRSASFGSPDQWLSFNKADVIFAFFGYNESFAGPEGLEKFRKDLADFIQKSRAQKYNGKDAPRLVLFSPIAHEDLRDRNLPDGKANNERIELYAIAMAEVARAEGVPFIDLFAASRRIYAAASEPSTINGVHLNERGDRRLAVAADEALFGEPARPRETAALEKLRGAVLDKSFHWFQRYRTTDGYSIYGGRADLKFVLGQTNRVVMQREMEMLDAMTAARDRRVWAVAQGGDLKLDDRDTPPAIPVTTNKPGKGPEGRHEFLEGEAAISRMQVAKGLKVNLFASEEQFPDLVAPVQVAVDPKGRLWVAAWPTYPHWNPREEMNDKLLILEDTNGDGRADACKVFADRLHNPTGFEFWNGGVIVAMSPDILFLKDTDGDDRADTRERIVSGIDSADTHHTSNSFVLDPGGALYFQEGTFHHTQVESPYGPAARCANAGVFRYEPRTQRFGVYVSYGFANPHGHAFDRWGQDFVTDGTGAETFHALPFSGRVEFPKKHAKPPKPYQQRTRPCAATEILSSRHFPESMQGNFLVTNVIGFQGILQYQMTDQGSGFRGQEVEAIVQSPDPNFRPSDLEVGADGALYFTDWHNPIIGHMQHNLRDPSRDHKHGRVYRVTHLDRPLLKPARIAGAPIEPLLDLLKEPDDRVRYRARCELGARKTEEVMAALKPWTGRLDTKDAEHEHHLLEALWLHQNHNVIDEALLRRMLRSPDFRARAAATRVLRAWREALPAPLELLRAQANDAHPRVRLEAVVAASDYKDARAAAVALEALKHERDALIDFALKETLSTLEPLWKPALNEGRLEILKDNPAAVDHLIAGVGTAELLKLPRTDGVASAILTRPGIPTAERRQALADLAKMRETGETAVLADAFERLAVSAQAPPEELVRMMTGRPPAELAKVVGRFKHVMAEGRLGLPFRSIGYAVWMSADGKADGAFEAASKSAEGLREFLAAVPLLSSETLRASLYARVRPMLFEGPATPHSAGIHVDYFEIVPPNVAVETLAKLKPKGSGTADEISLNVPQIKRRDAFALRFTGTLYAPKEGDYTFTLSSDDGSRLYLDGRLVVDNDGWHGMGDKSAKTKLSAGPHALIVTYFDQGGGDGLEVSWQGPGFAREKIPGRALGIAAGDTVVDAAIRAMGVIPGHEEEKFQDFGALLRAGRNRLAAIAGLRKIDRKLWPTDQAQPLINAILEYASALPASERTSPPALESLRLGQDLAGLLPAPEGARARASLKNLDVRIIVIRPVPHQMIYDRRKFAVEAGKPVEIVFENVDIMPHNLVITAPGAMVEVGQAAEQMGLEGQAKDYLPESPQILWATKLILPGGAAKLQFTAPKTPGAYPYVCTFPGHWLVMNGVMQVVEGAAPELASSVAAAPEAARPFVRMWTLKELEGEFKAPLKGRSFARGKALFTAAGCVKCHALGGEGSKLGPDLSKTYEKYKGRDLLRQMIEPSTEINEQFRAFLVATTDGDTVAGLIAKEDERGLHVVTNLLDPNDVTLVPKAKVKVKRPLELSLMPTGMLTTLQKEEILDLAAYVESAADPAHAAFK